MPIEAVAHHRPIKENASWMLAGRIAGFLLQALYFVLLARLLGVLEYGIFAGVFALVSTLTPYSALGSAMLFLRYLAADPNHAPKFWGNSLLTCFLFTLATVIGVVIGGFWMGKLAHPGIALMLMVANCFFYQITTLGSMLVFALGNARTSAWMGLLTNFFRVLVLLVMWARMGRADAFQWSVGVLFASALAGSLVWYRVHRTIGPAQLDLSLLRKRALEGLGFSFAGTTEAVNNDLDKIMLSHYGMNVQNGFYTLAYRVIDFATSPIGALNSAVIQRQFVLSHSGIRPMIRLAFKSISAAVLMGVAIGLGTLLVAPLLPRMAGLGFTPAIQVLRFLCWLPLIRGIHQMTGSAVTGAGHQNWRTAAQCVVALLNVGLNLMWIPRFGWVGAAWSTLASDGSLAILNSLLLILLARMLLRRETDVAPQPAPREDL